MQFVLGDYSSKFCAGAMSLVGGWIAALRFTQVFSLLALAVHFTTRLRSSLSVATVRLAVRGS